MSLAHACLQAEAVTWNKGSCMLTHRDLHRFRALLLLTPPCASEPFVLTGACLARRWWR